MYINLAIVDKGIYFVPQENEHLLSSIRFLDFQTNKIRGIASFERPLALADGLAFSPDGRWILYTNIRADQGGAELRLVENFR